MLLRFCVMLSGRPEPEVRDQQERKAPQMTLQPIDTPKKPIRSFALLQSKQRYLYFAKILDIQY